MARSSAATVEDYLQALPEGRRSVVAAVRALVRDHLPDGYAETMRWGMISYEIPLERYPDTYNGQPLAYAGLAAQKGYYVLYLMSLHQDPEAERRLREGFERAGKKLDLGKSCLRFRKLEDLPLAAIAEAVASASPEALIALYERHRPVRT